MAYGPKPKPQPEPNSHLLNTNASEPNHSNCLSPTPLLARLHDPQHPWPAPPASLVTPCTDPSLSAKSSDPWSQPPALPQSSQDRSPTQAPPPKPLPSSITIPLQPTPSAKIANGAEQVKADVIRIGNYTDGQFPTDSKAFDKRVFYTVYMGSENSYEATQMRAKVLADEIGSWHLDVCIDGFVSSLLAFFQTLTEKRPCYKVNFAMISYFLISFMGSTGPADAVAILR